MHRALLVLAIGCRAPDKPMPSACRGDVGPFTGQATHYDADGTGNCSFPASSDRMVVAMNHTDYEGAIWCGSCIAVVGPRGETTVRVVDSCPRCKQGDLDLSEEAFAKIAPLDAGRVPVTWRPVACDVSGPLAYHFKKDSNAFWTGIQIRNHRYAIAAVEAREAAGTYRRIERTDYNYFVAKKLGAGPYTLRVTDARANVIEDANIALGNDELRQGAMQFAICP